MENVLETVRLNILGLHVELNFTRETYLPLHDSLESFVLPLRESEGIDPDITVEFVENSFNGVSADHHLRQGYQSLHIEPHGGGVLFKYKTAQFLTDTTFSHIQLWSPFERRMSMDHFGSPSYTGDPSLRLILWGRVSLAGHCYMHGALVVLDGKYVLLLGDSGVGKTTLSRLACETGATCLTEEDPFVSLNGVGAPIAHAPPWPGRIGPETPGSGEIAAVFFLRHAPRNELQRLGLQKSCSSLLDNARLFKWLPETIPPSIELLDRMARTVPIYDFGFVADTTAVECLREALS